MKLVYWMALGWACLFALSAARLHAQSLTVMTYNLRLDIASDGEDAWPNRRGAVAELISGESPDVIGVQEALPSQIAYLDEALAGYGYVGDGRDGGVSGEHSAIFYKSGRVEVIASSTFWLSPTPDSVSLGWGAAYPRIATWARLRVRDSGEEVFVLNTHLDHKSSEARSRGLTLIRQAIDSLAEEGLPAILMGDLNANPKTPAIRRLRAAYDDAYEMSVARREGPFGTFAGFDGRQLSSRNRIDYVFTRRTPPSYVSAYRVIATQRDGRYPSDHLPVVAEVSFEQARREEIVADVAPDSLPIEDPEARYGREYIEKGAIGFGVGYGVNNGVKVFSFAPSATIRASRVFAVTFGAAFGRIDVLGERLTASAVGIAGRFYANGGNRAELFIEAGPSLAFLDGEQAFGFAVAPGWSFTGNDNVRLVVGVGGLAYAQVRTTNGVVERDVGLVFSPSLGMELLLGRKAPR